LALALSLPLALVCVVGGKVRALMEDDETLCHEERWKMTLDGVSDWRKHAAMADVADAGKFILIIVRATRLTSCFVHSESQE
jgi:hypothetical protein